jgi:hypothetical protein
MKRLGAERFFPNSDKPTESSTVEGEMQVGMLVGAWALLRSFGPGGRGEGGEGISDVQSKRNHFKNLIG